jgi:hypothetical protein
MAKIVPDGKHPNMYRLEHENGTLSDLVNLSRAKDALRQREATSREAEEHRREREELLKLLAALDASEAQLRRDECGAWNIMGKWGHISVMSQSFHLVCFTDECDLDLDINRETDDSRHRTTWRWTSAKKRLDFCTVVQDGRRHPRPGGPADPRAGDRDQGHPGPAQAP